MRLKALYSFAWAIILLGAFTTIWYLCSLKGDGWIFWGTEDVDIEKSGQFGDYIGGLVGTLFSLSGFIFLYLTLSEQRKAFQKERFENHFFEIVQLHRGNVNELSYTKHNGVEFQTASGRKVMRFILQEFIECYREVRKYLRGVNSSDYILPSYDQVLKQIIKENKLSAQAGEMAIIDIAFSIVFFGIGIEGEAVLRERFKRKYNNYQFYRILFYLKFKPKKENSPRYKLWEQLKLLNAQNLRQSVNEMYLYREHKGKLNELPFIAEKLTEDSKYDRYYGGHQHRLGHYYRHLFQAYKFLNRVEFFKFPQKYFYGKTLRAQLSTYEQALLFINSISSLGMKWEYLAEKTESEEGRQLSHKEGQLITRYHLIKNLPGKSLYDISYRDYYPNVEFESNE